MFLFFVSGLRHGGEAAYLGQEAEARRPCPISGVYPKGAPPNPPGSGKYWPFSVIQMFPLTLYVLF